MERRVSVKVQRYASNGLPPRIEQYEVPQKEGMTILDALMFIKENLDGSLAFRASCRMGICGSCAMFVNGYPYLACHTQIHEIGKQELIIKPLPNFPVVKDLVVDLSSLFDRHRTVLPYLIRSEEPDDTRPIVQRPDELEAFLKFSYCIKCGICVSGCPTCASDPTFLGPQALAQAWRYSADNRDEGFAKEKSLSTGLTASGTAIGGCMFRSMPKRGRPGARNSTAEAGVNRLVLRAVSEAQGNLGPARFLGSRPA